MRQRLTRLTSIYRRTSDNARRFGIGLAVADVAINLMNRLVVLRVLRCVHIRTPDPAFEASTGGKYRYEFLDRDTLTEYARHGSGDLPKEFVTDAVGKGDDCLGVWDGDTLASYGWYAHAPTRTSDGLIVHFDRRYVYMYNGFTHPAHRGHRLHAIGMTMALKEYRDRGFLGLVSIVDANNFSSLTSVSRMGYQPFGTIFAIRIFGRWLIHRTKGCAAYGFGLTPAIRSPLLERRISLEDDPARRLRISNSRVGDG
jgi:hypothetical protein